MTADDRSPAERSYDIEAMRIALARAVRLALIQHKRAGNPVAVWQDGAVAWIAPEDIVIPDEPSEG